MRVCFFGAHDRGYPRNRILRESLRRVGVEVVEAWVPEHRVFRRYPALLRAFSSVERESDALFVPEFRHKDIPLARLLTGRRPLVFDPLVSRYDTLVEDWRLHARGSGQAKWNRGIDALPIPLADRVVCDTWANGTLFVASGAKRERLSRVLVGAGEKAGRVVVTGEGEGLREVLNPGEHLIAVPRGDSSALAAALEQVIADEGPRQRVAAADRAREIATPERVGQPLREAFEACANRRFTAEVA